MRSTARGRSRSGFLSALGAAGVDLSFGGAPSGWHDKSSRQINFYSWDSYLAPNTQGDFGQTTGLDVNMSLFAKLSGGNPGDDVIVPGNDFVERMMATDKLLNTTDPAMIQRVVDVLIRKKPNITLFHEDNGQGLLVSGDVDLTVEYSGNIAQLMAEDDDIDFVVPREAEHPQRRLSCHSQGRSQPRVGAWLHQLPARRARRARHLRCHPIFVVKRRSVGANAGGLSREPRNIPHRSP